MNVTHSLGLILLQVLLACGCKGQLVAQVPVSQRSGWELSRADQPLVIVVTASAYNRRYMHKQVDEMMEQFILPAVLGAKDPARGGQAEP